MSSLAGDIVRSCFQARLKVCMFNREVLAAGLTTPLYQWPMTAVRILWFGVIEQKNLQWNSLIWYTVIMPSAQSLRCCVDYNYTQLDQLYPVSFAVDTNNFLLILPSGRRLWKSSAPYIYGYLLTCLLVSEAPLQLSMKTPASTVYFPTKTAVDLEEVIKQLSSSYSFTSIPISNKSAIPSLVHDIVPRCLVGFSYISYTPQVCSSHYFLKIRNWINVQMTFIGKFKTLYELYTWCVVFIGICQSWCLFQDVLSKSHTKCLGLLCCPNELLPYYVFALLNVSKSLSVIVCSGVILIYDSDYHKLLVHIDLWMYF